MFSGNQVSRFRQFLNDDERFEDLRESLAPRRHARSTHSAPTHIHPATASAVATAFEETYDDDMGDDNDDFDGMYGNDMLPNAQANNNFVGNGLQGHANLPSMAHSLPTLTGIEALPWDLASTLTNDGAAFPLGNFPHQQAQGQQRQTPIPTISSLIGSEGAYASGSMSAFGVSQASVAGSASAGPRQASTASAATATGTSTAQMHQGADAAESENMTG